MQPTKDLQQIPTFLVDVTCMAKTSAQNAPNKSIRTTAHGIMIWTTQTQKKSVQTPALRLAGVPSAAELAEDSTETSDPFEPIVPAVKRIEPFSRRESPCSPLLPLVCSRSPLLFKVVSIAPLLTVMEMVDLDTSDTFLI